MRPAQARTHQHYMPYVGNAIAVEGEYGVGLLGMVEQDVFMLMANHPKQRRQVMVWDDKLAKIAGIRAISQAVTGWAGHTDPEGLGPNHYARVWGYRLPDWYDTADDANNIESLAWGGSGKAQDVWQDWMNSPGHRTHILGTDPFYAAQTHVGVGYYMLEGSEYTHYWCILSAPPEGV